ncbi:MAG: S-methyl-5-thioribose-1-phosphate isomerase [Pseudomonadota bacterium]
MKVDGQHYRSIWLEDGERSVFVIDQTLLPFEFRVRQLRSTAQTIDAIATMVVRGAPLIGATAACGLFLAAQEDPSDEYLKESANRLLAARPTATNLGWALERMPPQLLSESITDRVEAARFEAQKICDEDVGTNSQIGTHGLRLLTDRCHLGRKNEPFNILTHCNAGWLATVDWGTALSPIFKAHDAGMNIHVWVDETRPRNQGASLTAWELKAHNIPHTIIADNAGGHLMQHGQVDACIVGSDRTTRSGDVCNKIGTYLKALAAKANDVPFFAAIPSSTIDWAISNGISEIPIEERAGDEVTHITGVDEKNQLTRVRLTPEGSHAANPAFDVTPRDYVSGIITERGVCDASETALLNLYPEHVQNSRRAKGSLT